MSKTEVKTKYKEKLRCLFGYLSLTAFLTSCTAKLETTSIPANTFSILSISKIIVTPGETITLEGRGFSASLSIEKTMSLGLTEAELPKLIISSDTLASLVIPTSVPFGRYALKFTQGNESQEIIIFSNGGKNDYPIANASPADLCSSFKFYNEQGELTEGTKDCNATVSSPEQNSGETTIPVDLRDCNADGQVACKTNESYKAAAKENIIPSNIRSGRAIAGVNGEYPSATSPLVNNSSTQDLNSFGPSTAPGSYEFFDSTGAVHNGTVIDGGTVTPGSSNIVLSTDNSFYRRATVLGDSDLTISNIKNSITLFGVTGGLTLTPANCSTPGEQNCKVTGTWFSGEACAANSSSCFLPIYTSPTQPLKAMSYDALVAGQNKMKSSLTLGGVTGTLADCSANQEVGCVTVAPFKSADWTNLTAGNIKKDIVVAGITGAYPSNTYPLSSNTATADLTSFGPSTNTGSYEFFDSAGNVYSATVADGGTITPNTTNQVFSAAGTMYRSASIPGDPDLVASKVKSGISIFGVAGSVVPTPSDCSSSGSQNCVTTGSYYASTACSANSSNCYIPSYNGGSNLLKAINVDNVSADKIVSGQAIAGVSGTAVLPATGKVLTGVTYGVGGTGSTGSLTLTSAADVIAGSAAYGEVGNLQTPSFTPPGLPPIYVRPATPVMTSAYLNYTVGGVTLNWSAAAGATGYIVVMNTTQAVSWVPTDGTIYSTGAQGSDQIIYVGNNTSLDYITTIGQTTSFYFAVYAYQADHWYSSAAAVKNMPACSALPAGGVWILVPGDPTYGTTAFCVQKYVSSYTADLQNYPVSLPTTAPQNNISQQIAYAKCNSLGANYHLIKNAEWMTLATNAANVGSNWSGGAVGSGSLVKGHSDNIPASSCAADADDSKAWVATSCTTRTTQGAQAFEQRRTKTLSNGNIIWDLGGNVGQVVDYPLNKYDKPHAGTTNAIEYTAFTGTTSTPRSDLVPLNSQKSWWDDNWNSTQGVGTFFPGNAGQGGTLIRGGHYSWDGSNSQQNAGLFAAIMNGDFDQYPPSGIRCVWTP